MTTAAPAQTALGTCRLSAGDQAWVDGAVDAWNLASRDITGIGTVHEIQAIFFDDDCVLTSSTAMNGGRRQWTATPHSGRVAIPGGPQIPAGATSFAMGGEGRNLFVMSTPSVWRAANVPNNGLGSLEKLMTVVVIHEGTHVAQVPTYGKRMERLSAAHKLPDDFSDDSIQERFESNPEFKKSIEREVDLLLAAAMARDRAAAARLADEARALMKARQQRWYTGKDAYLAEAEDIWLTMEGSAQWAAHQWLIDPRGGATDPRLAFGSFAWRGKWWSQNHGFALFMALDRLTGDRWKRHAFGAGEKTGLQMLDDALADRAV